MLPSWIRSSSGTPERRYLTATETTSRRFLSMSVRRAIRSPARTLLPSSTSGRRPVSGVSPHTLDEYLDDLGTRELRRRILASAQHLSHLRPREEDVRVLAVRARLGRRHPLAVEAEEGVLEEKGCDAQLVLVELLEDVLGVVGAVVAADSSVIPPHDEVRAAVVLAADGVEDGFP